MYQVEDGRNVKTGSGYDAGFIFAMEQEESSPRTSGGFNLGTNGNNYNKIFFYIANKQNVTASQKIHSTIHREIDYISDYKRL